MNYVSNITSAISNYPYVVFGFIIVLILVIIFVFYKYKFTSPAETTSKKIDKSEYDNLISSIREKQAETN